MKKFIITFLFALVIFSGNFITVPKLAFAQDATTTPADNFELKVAIDNPICDKKGGTGCTTTIKDLIAKILKVVIEFAIPVVVVMVIYSGFLYVIARGKPEAIETAHKTLTWTLIGAAIILGAQLISNVIIDTVSNISKDSGVSNSSITSGNNLVNSGSGSNAGAVNAVNNSNGTATAGVVLNNNTTGAGAGANTAGANTGTVIDPNTQKDVVKEPVGSQGDSVKTDPVVTPPVNNSPVAGTLKQYYVNANSGARLRSEPNTNSDANIIGTNAYGTVLNVSGETNGFWNIFKSDKTFMGYTLKSLLTLGNKAPVSNTSTSSGTQIGKVTITSVMPSVFVDGSGASITVNYNVEKNTSISPKAKFELICATSKGVSYFGELTPTGEQVQPGSVSTALPQLIKGYENGVHTCYIRYQDTSGVTKYSNKVSTFIGLTGDDYLKLTQFTAGTTSLKPSMKFTSLGSFTTTNIPVARCQNSLGVYVPSITSSFTDGKFTKGQAYSKTLTFPTPGVYYCNIKFDYGGIEHVTKFLGVTVS